MKVAVMGAGAVGGYYGGLLARAGHAVTLIGRPALVEAVRQQGGLLLDTQTFRERVAVEASTDPAAVRGAGLVLFGVKSGDTEAAGAAMAPHLDDGAVVLSLQNGVDNADRLGAVLGRAVVPAVVYVATEMAGPGHVRHHGRGELVLAPSAASDRVAALLSAAGAPTQVSGEAMGALWAKLILNCAWNALSAITGLPYGRLARADGVEALMRDVVAECLAVANADGVTVPGDAWAAVVTIGETMAGQQSSTAQDLARGRRTEIDHLNGHVVRRGEALGVPTPANRTLWTLVKVLEAKAAAANTPAPAA